MCPQPPARAAPAAPRPSAVAPGPPAGPAPGAAAPAGAGHAPAPARVVVAAVDPGYPQADRGDLPVAVANRLVHHRVEHFLHGELAVGLQVGAPGTALAQHLAVLVGEVADRFRASRVDPQHLHGRNPCAILSDPRGRGPSPRDAGLALVGYSAPAARGRAGASQPLPRPP